MTERIKLITRVNKEAGSEDFYEKSQHFGMLAAESFREERGRERQQRHRAQMTGLENIAETTLKVTDVLDYVKKQTARQRGWQKEIGPARERFGPSLKEYIESGLKPSVDSVCSDLLINEASEQGKQERQEVYLHLIRQLIRQLVVQYEYLVS